jgi:uncharacterized protein (TIGR02996 family)
MSDRDSMLATVIADPDDPLPRLVFADWLDEHGDPAWAELIRIQNGYFKHWTSAEEMAAREAALIEVVRARYPQVPGVTLGPPVRGFPEKVTLSEPPYEPPHQVLTEVLVEYPVTRFDFGGVHPFWVEDQCWWKRATVIDLSHCAMTEEEHERFFTGIDPLRFRALIWRYGTLTDEDVERLASTPELAGLAELGLPDNQITPAGCDALIASPYLTRLEYLDLRGNPVGPAARRLEERFGPALRLA